jgi:catechol 2,3-dioxygenase-like lactoylglutathione lyase family enzyme
MSGPVLLRVEGISLTVPDLAAAETFYRDALGFCRAGAPMRLGRAEAALLGAPDASVTRLALRLGRQKLDLLAFDPPGRPYPPDSTASDLWFQHCAIVVGDMAAAYAHLQGFAITPISQGGPQVLPPNTGSVSAYKFRDPFGHPLELLHFPFGTGDPVWQEPVTRGLFQGIDHSAIAVCDAASSAAFYVRVMGFRIGAQSENRGLEQHRLDAIAGDDVDVVALLPRHAPPHLELLGYRAGSRRPRPAGEGPADMLATRTFIASGALGPQAAGVIERRGDWDGRPAAALRDPDGHVVVMVERSERPWFGTGLGS